MSVLHLVSDEFVDHSRDGVFSVVDSRERLFDDFSDLVDSCLLSFGTVGVKLRKLLGANLRNLLLTVSNIQNSFGSVCTILGQEKICIYLK